MRFRVDLSIRAVDTNQLNVCDSPTWQRLASGMHRSAGEESDLWTDMPIWSGRYACLYPGQDIEVSVNTSVFFFVLTLLLLIAIKFCRGGLHQRVKYSYI